VARDVAARRDVGWLDNISQYFCSSAKISKNE
jgi:hypothetical protein